MSTAEQFQLFNSVILIPWLLMLLAPKWHYTQKIIGSFAFPLLYALAYSVYLLVLLSGSEESLDFMSLEGVMKLFKTPEAVLLGWVHYLAFDLFVGSWVFMQARSQSWAHYLLVPCLIGCFMFGPMGLLLFGLIRWLKKG